MGENVGGAGAGPDHLSAAGGAGRPAREVTQEIKAARVGLRKDKDAVLRVICILAEEIGVPEVEKQ